MSDAAVAVTTVRYAGFWRRFVAFWIDMLALAVVLGAIAAFHGVLFGAIAGLFSIADAEAEAVFDNVGFGVAVLVTWLYFSILESSDWQATCGKRALGLSVTDVAGKRIGFIRASARHFCKVLSGLFAGFGFLMIAWTKEKQALHDGITSTLVVRRSRQASA